MIEFQKYKRKLKFRDKFLRARLGKAKKNRQMGQISCSILLQAQKTIVKFFEDFWEPSNK
jgi:hypothetical protein